ncbi:MAG TPA: bifunctional DNA primase/polymerase [Terracidiphilus sp.]|nr:bifunctional DNA primase/polymerase [Terracidiphilus sp.]
MLDLAISYAKRAWYVFPCWPKSKKPMTAHGWKDATTALDQIREWWTHIPDANIAIATGLSKLLVVDFDHGLRDSQHLFQFFRERGYECTYAVHTGRRPEFGVQVYFQDDGTSRSIGGWELNGCSGDVRAQGGYVMAAGSIHPSGEPYAVLWDAPVVPAPDWVKQLKPVRDNRVNQPGQKVREGEGRHDALISVAGGLRNRGLDRDALYAALIPINENMCEPPVSDSDLQHIAESAAKYEVSGPGPSVKIGKAKEKIVAPEDWRTRWHSLEEMRDAPPVTFVIKDFLEQQGVTALAAPAGQRKSLIALNVAHACCTGEPLFDYFEVTNRPKHVLYLCPEMGISSFSARLKRVGLLDHVGKTLFCRTMNSEGFLALPDLTDEELDNAVIIVDTLVRFLEGNENESADMRVFAAKAMSLVTRGAAAVLLLHHSGKGTKESPELTLENVMRGSSELGAFVCCCWGTRLQDPTEPYKSNSFLANVKPRDFESVPFEVSSGEDCRLHIVGTPGNVVLKSKFTADRDGQQAEADKLILAHPDLTVDETVELIAAHGINRKRTWVYKRKAKLLSKGATFTSE